VNKTILKPRLAAANGRANTHMWDFPDVIKFRVAAHTICEKFQHPDYNLDRAQKLISSSMSRQLSTCNISSKYMHAFLSNLAHRQTNGQTDKRTRANAFTSFVGGNNNFSTKCGGLAGLLEVWNNSKKLQKVMITQHHIDI